MSGHCPGCGAYCEEDDSRLCGRCTQRLKCKPILQDWVMELGLRHQGVLVSIVRGCDSVGKEDPSKKLIRAMRAVILNAHCGEKQTPATFIDRCPGDELQRRMEAFRKNCDHLPHHFVMHLVHAVEIIAYHHPDRGIKDAWIMFYCRLCRGLHINPETKLQLDERLNLNEREFAAEAEATQGLPG